MHMRAQAPPPYRLERLSATQWRLIMDNPEPRVLRMPGDPAYSRVLMPGFDTRVQVGLPDLPTLHLAFGLPAGSRLVARVRSAQEDVLAADLAPYGGATPRGVHASTWVESTPVSVRDGLTVGGLRVHPALPAAGGLRWARRLDIDIRIEGNEVAGEIGGMLPPSSDHSSLCDVVNASDARQWLRNAAAAIGKAAARAKGSRLEIRTGEAGVYRLGAEELLAAGLPASADPRRLRLWLNGVPHPIQVRGEEDGRLDGSDALEWYAPRKEGSDGEYFDEWDDGNVFFLEWDGEAGPRGGTEDVRPASFPGAVAVDALPARLRLERDLEYHRGDLEYQDMENSERVPGETWMWKYLLKKDSLAIPFTLAQPRGGEASLEFRVKGASRDPSRVRVSINGGVVFDDTLASYDTLRLRVPVDGALLRDGENALVFRNVGIKECPPEDPVCSIERIYVDWADLRYLRSSVPIEEELLVDGGIGVGPELPARALLSLPPQAVATRGINLRSGAILDGVELDAAGMRLAVDGTASYLLFTTPRAPLSVRRFEYADLASPARQADYIIITHPLFLAQAQRLADYRARTDGFSTVIASVEDIYREFNHGHKAPSAIRAFMRNAWEQWREPRPRFAVIIGDASWDAKQRKSNSTRVDYVPTWGNPASDNHYVRFSTSASDPTPYLSIGRIPAETPAAADAVIDKIIEHESRPPHPMDNRILFSVGGENSFEHEVQLKPLVEWLIRDWVDPYCLEPRRIYKRTMTTISYDDLDTLIHEVNQGVSMFYFSGHGGTRVIDVGIERPDIFSNKGRYMLFATMSCNTAHFAEPFETGLNERFVLAPENGAIASLGTAGLGIIGYDYVVSRGMLRALVDSGLRSWGEILLAGKRELIRAFGTGDRSTINTSDQLCILGDPATHVMMARGPELLVRSEDIVTEPDILTEQQPARIRAVLRNVGLCMSDSVDVLLRVRGDGEVAHSERRRVAPFVVALPMEWEYDFAGVEGVVDVEITVDARDEVAEQREDNNVAVLVKTVQPRGIAQIFPLNHAVLPEGRAVEFVLANPSSIPESGSITVEVECAPRPDFATGVLRAQRDIEDVYTRLALGGLPGNVVLYWRARMLTDGVSGGWSPTRAFRLAATGRDDMWWQSDSGQLRQLALTAMRLDAEGALRLGTRTLELEVASGGFNGPFRTAITRVGDTDVSPNSRGFNIAVVEPVFGDVVATRNFDTYVDASVATDMATYLRGIPDDHILLVAVLDDANGYPPVSPNGSNIIPELRNELKRFGATLIDSLGFRDSYALIASRARASAAREMHLVLGAVFFRDTIEVRAREGWCITQGLAPVNVMGALAWSGDLAPDGAAVDVRVLARDVAGRDTVLAAFDAVPAGQAVDVSGVRFPAQPFPRIALRVRDPRGSGGPVLRGLSLDYQSRFPEIGITSQVVRSERDSVLEGEPMRVRVEAHNAGRVDSGPFTALLRIPGEEGVPMSIDGIAVGSSRVMDFALPTAGRRGSMSYEVSLDAANTVVEYYRANNVYSREFRSGRDGETPELEVLFDGTRIVNNDYVSPRPTIGIVLRDASPLPVTDTSAVQVFLDGRRVWLASDPAAQLSIGMDGSEKVRVLYVPTLSDGLHFLSVSGKDASGNAADSIPYQVRFYVTRTARIDQVLPWPSPTRGPMDITFRCTGAEPPLSAELRVYTLAGRLVRSMDVDAAQLRIGFNRIPWDGRDEDGDALANGVYFFKLRVRLVGEDIEQVGRFSVLR